MNLEKRLTRLYRDNGGFDAFVRADFDALVRETRRQWAALATTLMRIHPTAASVEVDDVAQEMILAAWAFLQRFDAERSSDVGRFVMWNAMHHGRRFLLRQRRQRDERGARRVFAPTPFSHMSDHAQDAMLASFADASDNALARLVAVEEVTSKLVQVLQAYVAADGDYDVAAERVLVDRELTAALGLREHDEARRAVKRAVEVAT